MEKSIDYYHAFQYNKFDGVNIKETHGTIGEKQNLHDPDSDS